MGLFEWCWVIYCMGFCSIWILGLSFAIWNATKLRFFEDLAAPEPSKWPLLSIVIAACDEEETIAPALQSLILEDYPNLEIIVVNDRSKDGTGEVLAAMAETDSRIQQVHISELPAGWLGKVNALHQGVHAAKGEYILFTDADIHFSKGMLRKAMSYAICNHLDHFVILPKPTTNSFLFDVVLNAFGVAFVLGTRVHKIETSNPKAFIGCGAFNLVRHSAFTQTEGFPWLKMEVADDVALGLMMKRAGGKASFAITRVALSVTWYPSLGAMFKGLEKNSYAVASHFSPVRMLAQVLFIWAWVLAPFLSFLPGHLKGLWLGGTMVGIGWIASAFFSWIRVRRLSLRYGEPIGTSQSSTFLSNLLAPLGHFILSLILLRAGLMCMWRGGIYWRGTFYATRDLKAGQRLRSPFI